MNGIDEPMMSPTYLTALPVYNEVETVSPVLDLVKRYSSNILVVDDGSTDGTAELLTERNDIDRVTHSTNRGYGAALRTAFGYAMAHNFKYIVTIDCDGQHEPQRIQHFVDVIEKTGADIVSGSRYLESFEADSPPPEQRRAINFQVTRVLNERLGFRLSDAFCGFKAYRVESLKGLKLTETGYAMPLELWVQAACQKLSVHEIPVPRIYLDESRSFGGKLDDAEIRLNHYREIMDKAFGALPTDCEKLRSSGSERVG